MLDFNICTKMKTLIPLLLVITFSGPSVSGSLLCWLCAGGGSSFEDCNTKKTVQNCSEPKYQEPGKGPLNRCAYFSYLSKEKKRVYAKSCTFASYCTETGEIFCKNVPGATQCQVHCCKTSLCNSRDHLLDEKTTSPPTTINTTTAGSFMVSGVCLVTCAVASFLAALRVQDGEI